MIVLFVLKQFQKPKFLNYINNLYMHIYYGKFIKKKKNLQLDEYALNN